MLRAAVVVGIISSLCLCLAPSSSALSISLSQAVNRTEMAFEDTLEFEITVQWDGPPTAYVFEHAIRLKSEQLKVDRFLSNISSSGHGEAEVTTKSLKYYLVPVLSGAATIEPVAVEYITWPDSLPGLLMTDPVTVTVANPLPKSETTKSDFPFGWVVAMSILVLGGAAAGVVSAMRRKKKPVEKPKSAMEGILDDLATAKAQAGSDLKTFQTGLHRVLLTLVKTRYKVDTAKLNTNEVVEVLQEAERDEAVRTKISEWLVRAEREKYSPVAAPPGEVIRLETEVRRFLESLK